MSLDYILSIIDFAIKISIIVSTAFFENETIDVVRDSTSLMNILKDFFSVYKFEEYFKFTAFRINFLPVEMYKNFQMYFLLQLEIEIFDLY